MNTDANRPRARDRLIELRLIELRLIELRLIELRLIELRKDLSR